MKKRTKIIMIVLSILIMLISYCGVQKYEYPTQKELNKKIGYLNRIIKEPFGKQSDLTRIAYENAEWSLFSLSFSTYAFTNISFRDSTFKPIAIRNIDLAIQKAITDTIYKNFSDTNPYYPEIDTAASILYLGHLNLMLGCHRLLDKNSKYADLNDKITESLYQRYLKSNNFCLDSYFGMSWIPDNTVALASIKIHSQNTGSHYDTICTEWIKKAKTSFIENQTNLLCSRVNDKTGRKEEEARGAMIGWSIFFIYRFDKEYAKELYEIYKDKFSTNLIVVTLFKERYHNSETSNGDIDSGPLFLGYSIPANAFAFAGAVAFKDLRTAKRLQRLISIGSKKIETENELKYETRFINLQINPLAEALLLYFETMTDWKTN
ncbi:MAG: hypothetical protein LCH54_16040 [Bacteroidetes bacterium]|nr:hypothetical protein [Bacteroidota bacterium]